MPSLCPTHSGPRGLFLHSPGRVAPPASELSWAFTPHGMRALGGQAGVPQRQQCSEGCFPRACPPAVTRESFCEDDWGGQHSFWDLRTVQSKVLCSPREGEGRPERPATEP